MTEELTWAQGALLFLAGAGGGVLNAIVGGGSFLTFPALLAVGVLPVPANATSTLALWPGGISSAYGYRKHLAGARRLIAAFAATSFVGGVLGSLLLLKTDNDTFRRLVPWLLLGATMLFSFGPRVTRWLKRAEAEHAEAAPANTTSGNPVVPGNSSSTERQILFFGPALVAQFFIAIYIGYFGGGGGILMLATLSIMGLEDLHFMNGVKNLLATIVNGVALVAFVIAGAIAWAPALWVLVGATIGGYAGSQLATRTKPTRVRAFATAVAWSMTAWFFWNDFVKNG